MSRVGLQFHSLAWVKLCDGIHQSQDAVGRQFIDLDVGRQVFANVESDALHQWEHFGQQLGLILDCFSLAWGLGALGTHKAGPLAQNRPEGKC
jgi:hypothetical protein